MTCPCFLPKTYNKYDTRAVSLPSTILIRSCSWNGVGSFGALLASDSSVMLRAKEYEKRIIAAEIRSVARVDASDEI